MCEACAGTYVHYMYTHTYKHCLICMYGHNEGMDLAGDAAILALILVAIMAIVGVFVVVYLGKYIYMYCTPTTITS